MTTAVSTTANNINSRKRAPPTAPPTIGMLKAEDAEASTSTVVLLLSVDIVIVCVDTGAFVGVITEESMFCTTVDILDCWSVVVSVTELTMIIELKALPLIELIWVAETVDINSSEELGVLCISFDENTTSSSVLLAGIIPVLAIELVWVAETVDINPSKELGVICISFDDATSPSILLAGIPVLSILNPVLLEGLGLSVTKLSVLLLSIEEYDLLVEDMMLRIIELWLIEELGLKVTKTREWLLPIDAEYDCPILEIGWVGPTESRLWVMTDDKLIATAVLEAPWAPLVKLLELNSILVGIDIGACNDSDAPPIPLSDWTVILGDAVICCKLSETDIESNMVDEGIVIVCSDGGTEVELGLLSNSTAVVDGLALMWPVDISTGVSGDVTWAATVVEMGGLMTLLDGIISIDGVGVVKDSCNGPTVSHTSQCNLKEIRSFSTIENTYIQYNLYNYMLSCK